MITPPITGVEFVVKSLASPLGTGAPKYLTARTQEVYIVSGCISLEMASVLGVSAVLDKLAVFGNST